MKYSVPTCVAALALVNGVVGGGPGCPAIKRFCASNVDPAGSRCKVLGHLKAPATTVPTSCSVNTQAGCRNLCATDKSCKSFVFNDATKGCSTYKVASSDGNFVPTPPSSPGVQYFWDKTCFEFSHLDTSKFILGDSDSFGEILGYFELDPVTTSATTRTLSDHNIADGTNGVDATVFGLQQGRLYTIDTSGRKLYGNVLKNNQTLFFSTQKVIASETADGVSPVTCRIDLGNIAKCNTTIDDRKQFITDINYDGRGIGLVYRKHVDNRNQIGAECVRTASSPPPAALL